MPCRACVVNIRRQISMKERDNMMPGKRMSGEAGAIGVTVVTPDSLRCSVDHSNM